MINAKAFCHEQSRSCAANLYIRYLKHYGSNASNLPQYISPLHEIMFTIYHNNVYIIIVQEIVYYLCIKPYGMSQNTVITTHKGITILKVHISTLHTFDIRLALYKRVSNLII